jgi:hypothetical protein
MECFILNSHFQIDKIQKKFFKAMKYLNMTADLKKSTGIMEMGKSFAERYDGKRIIPKQ